MEDFKSCPMLGHHPLLCFRCPEHGVSSYGRGSVGSKWSRTSTWRRCARKCRETIGCRYWTFFNKDASPGRRNKCVTTESIPRKHRERFATSGNRNCGSN